LLMSKIYVMVCPDVGRVVRLSCGVVLWQDPDDKYRFTLLES